MLMLIKEYLFQNIFLHILKIPQSKTPWYHQNFILSYLLKKESNSLSRKAPSNCINITAPNSISLEQLVNCSMKFSSTGCGMNTMWRSCSNQSVNVCQDG